MTTTHDEPGAGPPDDDLDHPPAPSGAPRPVRRRGAALTAAAVAGLLAGGLLAGAGQPAVPDGGQLLATLDLRGVVLTERPVAVLTVGLVDLGSTPVDVDTVAVSGAGLVPTTRPLARTVRPRAPVTVTIEVPLSCSRADGAGLPAQAAVAVRRAPGGGAAPADGAAPSDRQVTAAVPLGQLSRRGGLCSTADDVLPPGWIEQARVTRWSLGTDRTLIVDLVGLPADVTDVVAAEVDGVMVPVPQAPVGVRGGAATVRFGEPGSGCQASGTHALVPTGLQLLVHSDDVSRFVYVPVDLALADWVMQAFVDACPDSPGGPSAVRPLLGG